MVAYYISSTPINVTGMVWSISLSVLISLPSTIDDRPTADRRLIGECTD